MAISLLGRAQGQYRSSMAMQQLQFSARGRAWAAPARRQAPCLPTASRQARVANGSCAAVAAPQHHDQHITAPSAPAPSPAQASRPQYRAATATLLLALGAAGATVLCPDAAQALDIQAEPSNALSLPTWAIHVSSVVEWVTGMGLFWKYAEVTGNPLWKGMTWGMLPSLGSAMCACTWHFFYNAPSLEFLVALQAFLTVVGNCTCLIAAYRLYDGSQKQRA